MHQIMINWSSYCLFISGFFLNWKFPWILGNDLKTLIKWFPMIVSYPIWIMLVLALLNLYIILMSYFSPHKTIKYDLKVCIIMSNGQPLLQSSHVGAHIHFLYVHKAEVKNHSHFSATLWSLLTCFNLHNCNQA